jgi:phosphoribosylformimino-5-aminoimidazole carboxamide ribotide isomerase
LAQRRPDIDLAAAGGIRGIDDLTMLAADSVRYALVATALHQKKISSAELASLRG